MKRSAISAINSTPPPPSSPIRNSSWSTSWGHRKFLEIRSSEQDLLLYVGREIQQAGHLRDPCPRDSRHLRQGRIVTYRSGTNQILELQSQSQQARDPWHCFRWPDQRGAMPAGSRPARLGVCGHAGPVPFLAQLLVDPFPELFLDQRLLLARVDCLLMGHLPEVQDIGQQPPQCRLREGPPAALFAVSGPPPLRGPVPRLDLPEYGCQRAMLQIERKDDLHAARFFPVHHQFAPGGGDIVAQHRRAPHPFPLAPGGCHLVPRSILDHSPFELRILRRTAIRGLI